METPRHALALAADPLLYDLPAAGETMHLSRSQLIREINAGRLGSVKVGRRRLIPRDALLAFVEQLKGDDTGPEAA